MRSAVLLAFSILGSLACAGRRGGIGVADDSGVAGDAVHDARGEAGAGTAPRDAATDAHADVDPRDGGIDVRTLDVGTLDAGLPDSASRDSGVDTGVRDTGVLDTGALDAGVRDTGARRDSGPVIGVDTPCANGSGWSLFRFHFDGSANPIIDVWNASCSYSLAPSSTCNVIVAASSPSTVMSGYAVELGTSVPYLRVRYSVEGLDFTDAALYVQARSYSTSASTSIRAWSPIHGERTTGPVDVDFTYDWYWLGWTSFVDPDDDPLLTAIQIYSGGGSGSLAVHAVELCVE